MLVPLPLKIANSLLTASKLSHDIAITAVTSSTEFLFTHNFPSPLRDVSIDVVSNLVMIGDSIGNFVLQLYVLILHLMG
jgi:hypothetical protein